MSLRDQLLAKGLVSGKRARRIDQEEKRERKQEKGNKKRRRELEREARAREEAENAAREAARREARAEYAAQKERMERALQVRNLILGNRIPSRGSVPFHHKDLDGRRLLRLDVSSGVAHQLRCGEAAVVADHAGPELRYVVVGRRAAERIVELAPRLVVFWAREAEGLRQPDLAFLQRDWEPSLRPRRATPEDLRRFGGRP